MPYLGSTESKKKWVSVLKNLAYHFFICSPFLSCLGPVHTEPFSVLNSTCFPMRSASPDKERSAGQGQRKGAKEKRQRRASGWSYSLITCLPCKCSSNELHRQLQETATPFQIIKYWPIKVRTWEWASSSHSLPTSSSSSSPCLHSIASISSSISPFPFLY